MSDKLGARTFGEREELIFLGREIHEQRDYSENTAEAIDNEISTLVTDGIKTVRDIIKKHRNKLDEIAEALIKGETLEKEEFEAIFEEAKKPAEVTA